MSQFSSEALWWSHHHSHRSFPTHPPPPPTTTNNHFLWLESQQAAALSASMNFNFIPDENMEEEVEEDDHQNNDDEREFMFEKPLTPSDVGKLNRLVIPKQYAEKYFPLGGESVEKGLLLSFEDEAEKVWRFRYSYWNSSQSYVLTKGWSRFVKEKQLDAGDVVWFERRRSDGQHLVIRWRRRVPPPQTVVEQTTTISSPPRHHHQVVHASHANAPSGSSGGWTQMFYSAHPYPPHHVHGSLLYQPPPDCLHAAVEQPQQNPKTVKGNSKQLRLFGVTLDCQADDDDEDDDDEQQSEPAVVSDGSSYATTPHFFHPYQQQQHDSSSSHSHRYQEYDFSRDMDQTRYDRGRDMSM